MQRRRGHTWTAYSPTAAALRSAFADLDRDVVVKVGPAVDPKVLGPLPRNASVHRWVPQLSLLAHVGVRHARGDGRVLEGLWHGVPMVAVPQAVDQFGNADRLVELGVGRRLDVDATADELRAAVVALESRRRSPPAARPARGAAGGGGAAAAADVVEAEAGRAIAPLISRCHLWMNPAASYGPPSGQTLRQTSRRWPISITTIGRQGVAHGVDDAAVPDPDAIRSRDAAQRDHSRWARVIGQLVDRSLNPAANRFVQLR